MRARPDGLLTHRGLSELAELAAAATPGPWTWIPSSAEGNPRMFLEAIGRNYGHVLKISWPELLRDGDADFIARANPLTVATLVEIALAAEDFIHGTHHPHTAVPFVRLVHALAPISRQGEAEPAPIAPASEFRI